MHQIATLHFVSNPVTCIQRVTWTQQKEYSVFSHTKLSYRMTFQGNSSVRFLHLLTAGKSKLKISPL